MSRVLAGLAAVPVLLIGGVLTVAFLLPADRMYLLGPLIAGAMIITMVVLLTLLPRVIRWRMAEMFGGELSPLLGHGGFSGGRRGGAGGTFPFPFPFAAGLRDAPVGAGEPGGADDGDLRGGCRHDHHHDHGGHRDHAGHGGSASHHGHDHGWTGPASWAGGSDSFDSSSSSSSGSSSSCGSDSWSSSSSDSSSSSSSW